MFAKNRLAETTQAKRPLEIRLDELLLVCLGQWRDVGDDDRMQESQSSSSLLPNGIALLNAGWL